MPNPTEKRGKYKLKSFTKTDARLMGAYMAKAKASNLFKKKEMSHKPDEISQPT